MIKNVFGICSERKNLAPVFTKPRDEIVINGIVFEKPEGAHPDDYRFVGTDKYGKKITLIYVFENGKFFLKGIGE